MKKFIANQSFPTFLAALCGAVFITGCAVGSPPPLLTEQVTPSAVSVTNTVVRTIDVTNAQNLVIPVYQTNTSVVTVTNEATNYVVNSTVTHVLDGAGLANTLSAPVNPYSGLVGAGLAALTAGLGIYAGVVTKAKNTSQSIAKTMVQAIESSPDTVGATVKGLVSDIAKGNGTAQTVHDFVQNVTG